MQPRRTDMAGSGNLYRAAPRHRRAAAACLALAAVLLTAAAGPARAADWLGDTPLRGTMVAAPAVWDGYYGGAAYGIGNSSVDFGDSAHDLISFMLRNTVLQNEQHPEDWTALGKGASQISSFGGFFGYNMRWDDLVLGGEVAYNYMSGGTTMASDSMTRRVSLSTGTDVVTIDASSSIQLKDYITLRARVGYPTGQFLPYAFLGLAVGRFNYMTTVTLAVSGTDNYVNTATSGKDDAFTAGLDVGLGVDVALTSNLFLRGEWEYMAYAPISGIRYTANTARAAIGVKF